MEASLLVSHMLMNTAMNTAPPPMFINPSRRALRASKPRRDAKVVRT